MSQESLLDWQPPFDGATYDAPADHARLSRQMDRIRELMSDGKYRTLSEIEAATGAPAASASAQLRNLRKERFGGHQISKRSRGARETGLFEYQLIQSSGAVTPKRQTIRELREELAAALAEIESLRAQLKGGG